MGYAKKRTGRDGKRRYTAVYVDLRGSERSAGTFASEKAANQAWQKAEVEQRQGRVGDPARGRQTLRRYVERWLPNHVIEPTTREKYAYYLGAHILPVLGGLRMADIFPEHIREWIAWMQREGRSAWTIQYCKSSILNSIFTTALNDQVTYIHPCRGVKMPTVPATPRTIITPEQFDAIYAALPSADAQLLVETAIETGLRWVELSELRPSDLDLARMLTVSRKVIELGLDVVVEEVGQQRQRRVSSAGPVGASSTATASCCMTAQGRVLRLRHWGQFLVFGCAGRSARGWSLLTGAWKRVSVQRSIY